MRVQPGLIFDTRSVTDWLRVGVVEWESNDDPARSQDGRRALDGRAKMAPCVDPRLSSHGARPGRPDQAGAAESHRPGSPLRLCTSPGRPLPANRNAEDSPSVDRSRTRRSSLGPRPTTNGVLPRRVGHSSRLGRIGGVLAVWTAIFVASTVIHAAPTSKIVDTGPVLRGIQNVNVFVFLEGDPVAGVTNSNLQTAAELHLRQAGIHVVAGAEPTLWIDVVALRSDAGLYAISVHSSLIERGLVARPRLSPSLHSTMVDSWQRPLQLAILGNETLGHVSEMVQEDVDGFANDYLAANPPVKQ